MAKRALMGLLGSAKGILALVLAIYGLQDVPLAKASDLPAQLSFQNLFDNRDVTTGEIDAIVQDSQGFIWIGAASALFRYDAYDLKQVDAQVSGDKTASPKPVKFVKSLFEDKQHFIWVASRNGLYRYNPQAEKLEPIPDAHEPSSKISGVNFLKVAQLPNGKIIACSLAGLYVIDPANLSYSLFTPDAANSQALKGKSVNAAWVDRTGRAWLGTDQGLELFDWDKGQFVLFKPLPDQATLVAENFVTDIVGDPEIPEVLWLGTSKGLIRYDTQTHSSQRFANNPNDPTSLGGDDIWGLSVDLQGTLWIATDGGGLSALDRARQKFTNHKFEAGRAASISSNQVRTVYTDQSGDIWAGNFPNGLNYFDRTRAAIQTLARDLTNPNSLSHNAVTAVAEGANNSLWVGTDGGGLNYVNPAAQTVQVYKHDPQNERSLGANAVTALYVEPNGVVWLGTFGAALHSLDPATNTITRLAFDKRSPQQAISTSKILNGAAVWSIKPDRDDANILWLTTRTGGISAYNKTTQVFTNYFHLDEDANSLINNSTWNTLEDSYGNFWVGTAGGLDKFDKKTGQFKHYAGLSNNSAISLFEDSKRRLWVGTDAGLNLLDRNTETFKAYTKADGFIDDTIRRILEDKDGKIWVSTLNGFASFDPESRRIRNYNRIAGRLTGGFSRSGIVRQNGDVLFGGVNGLRIISPSALSDNTAPPRIALTDFKLMADSVPIGGADSLLTQSINMTDVITLDYTQSMFTLDFAALNFRDPAKNTYAYKLDGFDRDWIEAGAARSAKYTNVNPGQYVFRIKAANNDGVWSPTDKQITIIQLPPPWKTWWAYTAYMAMGLGLVFQFIRSQQRKRRLVEEQNRLLEIKVAARTAEVLEKSKDIEAMLSNIQQGLFTINEQQIVHEQYSQFLETIFETTQIAGQSVAQLIFASATSLGSDVLDSAQAALAAILGEDAMNFDFNECLLPKEIEIKVGETAKILNLEWNPIVDGDKVVKLMISVRDVTLVKKMEKAASEQKRQLDIVSQLLNLSAEKFLNFETAAEAYIATNQQVLAGIHERGLDQSLDEQTLSVLFRNMHTVKGNSRTFGLSYLSNVVHDVESKYTDIKAAKQIFEPDVLLQDLHKAKSALDEYGHVYRNVLKRTQAEERQAGFWMPNSILQKIQHYVEGGYVADLKTFVSRINAKTLEQCLQDGISGLTSIAIHLGKKTPQVVIQADGFKIRHNTQPLLRDIFAHILRNSVDHGLEPPAERLTLGKSEAGEIRISAAITGDQLCIQVCDDGRGLNLGALYEKGLARGKWSASDRPSAQAVADIIFESGVTTQSAVTDISGRGVGMDAVKQFVVERKGSVSLQLAQPQLTELAFMAFKLVIILPEDVFFVG